MGSRSTRVEYDEGFDKVLSGGVPVDADVVRAICAMHPGDELTVVMHAKANWQVRGEVRSAPAKKVRGEGVHNIKKLTCVWPPQFATAPMPDALKDSGTVMSAMVRLSKDDPTDPAKNAKSDQPEAKPYGTRKAKKRPGKAKE